MFATPPLSEVERPSTEHQCASRSARFGEVSGSRLRDHEDHIAARKLYLLSPAPYQAKSLSPPRPMGASGSSSGPLMNPSSETESAVRTFPWAPIIRARFAGHNSASCFFPTRTRPRPFLPQAQDQISRCLATSRIPCPRVAAFHGRLKDTRTVAQTAKVTEHAPRGRDTSRNSLVPLGASESPRLAWPRGFRAAVSRPPRPGVASGIFGTKVVPGNFTTGLVSSRYLGFGVSQIPRRHRQLAFPPIPLGTPSRLTALARLGSLLRSVRPPGTDFEPNVEPSNGSNPLDQHICPLTCASVATERVTRRPPRFGVRTV